MPTAAAITASVNSSREPVRATCHSSQGNRRRPTTQHQRDERRDLQQRLAERRPRASRRRRVPGEMAATLPPSIAANGGSSTRTSTVDQVLDDQPAHRDLAVDRVEHAARLERLQQHHGAGDRQRQRRTPAPRPRHQPHQAASQAPSSVARRDLHHRARQRDACARPTSRRARNAGRRRTSAASRRSRRAARRCPTSATNPGVAGPMRIPASR